VDARDRLTTGQVKDRAAAARELAERGDWSDMELLVRAATTEKSPSVRLYAAAAAADIAAAHRGASGQRKMTRKQRDELHTWAGSIDPVDNPSILGLLSAAGDKRAVDRLCRALRDPRSGVRAGAAIALRRLALSAAAADDRYLPGAIRKLLAHPKLPVDAIADVTRLIGECGWIDLRDALGRAASTGGAAAEAATEARQRLSDRDPSGVWLSSGTDVLLPEPAEPGPWMIVVDMTIHRPDGQAPLGDHRLLRAPRVAKEGSFDTLQIDGETFYRLAGGELTAFVEAAQTDLAGDAAAWIASQLEGEEGPAAERARALATWRSGDLEAADALLSSLSKPKADVLWWRAQVLHGLGRPDEAKAMAARFLKKAPKKSPFRADAEALVARA